MLQTKPSAENTEIKFIIPGKVPEAFVRPNWNQLALAIMLLSLACSAIAFVVFKPTTGVFEGFNPFLVDMAKDVWHTQPVDRRAFLFAHKIFLIMLGLSILLFAQLPTRLKERLSAIKLQTVNTFAILTLVAFTMWTFGGYDVWPGDLIAGALFVPAAYLLYKTKFTCPRWLTISIIIALIAIASVPGLLVRPSLASTPVLDIMQLQQHYAVCNSFADRLAKHIQLGHDTWMHYGVLMPTLIGIFEQHHKILNFGHLVRLTQFSQIALLAAVAVLLLISAKKHSSLAIVAFLAALPWYHCNHLGTWYPNHSGWRLIGIFGGLAVACLARRSGLVRLAFIMGFIAGVATLLNLETGLVLGIGFALMLFLLRHQHAGAPLKVWTAALASGAAGLVLSVGAYLGIFYLATGYWPTFLDPRQILILLSVPQIITMPTPPALISYVMFIHASYILFRTAVQKGESVTFQQALRACVSFIIIVWEIYYWNRAFYSNLAAMWCLYSILLIDYMRPIYLALRGSKRVLPSALLACVVASICVVPHIYKSWRESYTSYDKILSRFAPPPVKNDDEEEEPTAILSGVVMPKQFASFMETKAQRVKYIADRSTINYVTMYSLLVPKLSDYAQPFPCIDPYFGINTAIQHELYCQSLVANQPEYILIDDAKHDPALQHRSWFRLFQLSVFNHIKPNYKYTASIDGWVVFRQIKPGEKVANQMKPGEWFDAPKAVESDDDTNSQTEMKGKSKQEREES